MSNFETYKRAKKLIPGGTQLLSKRPEMFSPESWPSYYSKASGVKIWDLENHQFLDMSIMGVGAVILGYADPFVNHRVIDAVNRGSQTTLNAPEEVELAEKLLELHPWFDSVRYSKAGGEAMAIAVRISRAATGRDKVLFNGYHGWHDWYISANLNDKGALDGQLMPGLEPLGIPRVLQGTSAPLDLEKFDGNSLGDGVDCRSIAAIVVEPARGVAISDNTLKALRNFCSKHGIVLIFDEITSGFRMCAGGMHRDLATKPDIAVFAKAMSNGFPMAAIVGIESVMEAVQKTFISSTNWTDNIGLAASLATIEKYEVENVARHLKLIGAEMKTVWKNTFDRYKIPVSITGIDSLPAFSIKNFDENRFTNYLVTSLAKKGFLGFRQFKPSLAHTSTHLQAYEEALDSILFEFSNDAKILDGFAPSHSGFYRIAKE